MTIEDHYGVRVIDVVSNPGPISAEGLSLPYYPIMSLSYYHIPALPFSPTYYTYLLDAKTLLNIDQRPPSNLPHHMSSHCIIHIHPLSLTTYPILCYPFIPSLDAKTLLNIDQRAPSNLLIYPLDNPLLTYLLHLLTRRQDAAEHRPTGP